MKLKRIALTSSLVLLFQLIVVAQPVLPSITGAADNGVVLLSWVCQYNGVKAIAVRHSVDSLFNYKIIGYVKHTTMGMQAFVDGHPQPGNNYYKLNIVFNSGLNWSSNHFRVHVDSAQFSANKKPLPGNDSLQRFIVKEEVMQLPVIRQKAVEARADSALVNDRLQVKGVAVSLFFDGDSTAGNTSATDDVPTPVVVRRRVALSFPDHDVDGDTFIKSKYLFVNKLNGHVEMHIPDDLKQHHYSIKFYNRQFIQVLEVPKITAADIIIDKRNFQKKGTFKFVLKRDGIEFESGYLNL